jgi:hypothetical protein
MTRSLLILCALLAAQSALADDDLLPKPPGAQTPAQTPAPAPAPGQSSPQPAAGDPRAACAADDQNLCAGVQPGGGRIIACLKQHKNQVSDGCKQAILKATRGST